MRIKRKAFTLMEIIIAMAMMMIVILSVLMLNQTSNQSSMDAYYETLCFSLGREPIEVFRGLGYDTVLEICKNKSLCPAPYKIGEFTNITFNPKIALQYPADAENFQRCIDLTHNSSGKYINIKVTISPKNLSKAELWLSRKSVILESNIVEKPKW